MVLGVLHELVEDFHFLLKILNEFVMLLISPRIAQGDHLPVDARDLCLKFLVESFEILSKAAKFGRVDNCLCHESTSSRIEMIKAARRKMCGCRRPSADAVYGAST
jgi:hypothetical protein